MWYVIYEDRTVEQYCGDTSLEELVKLIWHDKQVISITWVSKD